MVRSRLNSADVSMIRSVATIIFAAVLATAVGMRYERRLNGGYYSWKSKCLGFQLLNGTTGDMLTFGQLSMNQVYSNDMYANYTEWDFKLGDPTANSTFQTRIQQITQGNLYECPDAQKSQSCFTMGSISDCVICTKQMVYGMNTPASFYRPNEIASWFVDSLPFPHKSLQMGGGSMNSFATSELWLEIKYDAFNNPPAKSVPGNVSIWSYSNSDVTVSRELLEARRMQSDAPDCVLVFTPVANDRCAWKPF